jgi:hypothetical protein
MTQRSGHRLAIVDDDTVPGWIDMPRQGDTQHLFRLVFRLDQNGRDHGHPGLDPAVLARETDLLGIRLLALEAEFRPRREDELGLLASLLRLALLSLRGGSFGRLRRSRCSFWSGLGRRLCWVPAWRLALGKCAKSINASGMVVCRSDGKRA